MLDLDDLKHVNDTHGHQVGDDRIRYGRRLHPLDDARERRRVPHGRRRVHGSAPRRAGVGRVHVRAAAPARSSSQPPPIGVRCGRHRVDRLRERRHAPPSRRRRVLRREALAAAGRHLRRRASTPVPARRRARRRDAATGAAARDRACARGRREGRRDAQPLRDRLDAVRAGRRSRRASTPSASSGCGSPGCCTTWARSASPTPSSRSRARSRPTSGTRSAGRSASAIRSSPRPAFTTRREWVLTTTSTSTAAATPTGSAATTIPLESRIILVADAYEAMTADRPYGPRPVRRRGGRRARRVRRYAVRPRVRRRAPRRRRRRRPCGRLLRSGRLDAVPENSSQVTAA